MSKNKFKERFRYHLRRIGYKQKEIAHLLGVDASTLSKWVNDPEKWPGDALIRICELLELDDSERQDLFTLVGLTPAREERVTIPEISTPHSPLQRPPRVEHFTDRKVELNQILVEIKPGRVVTLCGPGGIGKSALAAEAIWTLAPGNEPPEGFPDGIIFHSFYNQPQADLALEHISRSFGSDPHEGSPRDVASRTLMRRTALLVLDGTEVANNLQAVLAIRGNCGVLITSRRRRDADTGWQYLNPLPFDDLDDPAVKLLQAIGGVWAADKSSARRICELVGGLPLAVRLAGRYLAEQEEEAADYLIWLEKTRLQALDYGRRQSESVPLLLKQSIAQLSKIAREVLGVVGLLGQDAFDRTGVTHALSLADTQVRRPLWELVNYGLLVREGTRYRISHALIHTYARQKMTPSHEVVKRLAVYYTNLVKEQCALGPVGYAHLTTERVHLMSVLARCIRSKIYDAAHTLASEVSSQDGYLEIQGYWTERITAIKAGLTATRKLNRRSDEGQYLCDQGNTCVALGRVEEAIGHYEQSLSIAREVGDRHGEGVRLSSLGNAYSTLGKLEEAIEYYEQSLIIAREVGDRRGEGARLDNLGVAVSAIGQVDKGIRFYEQALAIMREVGDQRGEGTVLGNLGNAFRNLGLVEHAIRHHEQALTVTRKVGDRQGEAVNLSNLGIAYHALGHIEQAKEYYEQALTIVREIGDRRGEGVDLGNLGNINRELGQMEQAIEFYEEALAIAREVGDRRGEGSHLGNLGNAYSDLNHIEQAIEFYEEALAIAREVGDRRGEGSHLGNLGNAYKELGNTNKAEDYLKQSLVIFEEIRSPVADQVRTWLVKLMFTNRR